jgi:hypothetical protein
MNGTRQDDINQSSAEKGGKIVLRSGEQQSNERFNVKANVKGRGG